MSDDINFPEVARKALIKIASERTHPTPERYCSTFIDLSGYRVSCSKAPPSELEARIEEAHHAVLQIADALINKLTPGDARDVLAERIHSAIEGDNVAEAAGILTGIIQQIHQKEQGVAVQHDLIAVVAESNTTTFRNLEHCVESTRGKLHDDAKAIASSSSTEEIRSLAWGMAEKADGLDSAIKATLKDVEDSSVILRSARERIVELEKQVSQYAEFVSRDPLTKVFNRRGFEEAWKREVSRGRRTGTTMCLVVVDADNFKQINDTLGHHVGDEALVYLASQLQEHLRVTDVVSRYGGEEFVVLLPDTVLGDGVMVMERLQREMTRNVFMAEETRQILITFSAGITQVVPGESAAEAFKRADEAMYQAKQMGKNRVISG